MEGNAALTHHDQRMPEAPQGGSWVPGHMAKSIAKFPRKTQIFVVYNGV
jgi:hypothetical protein